ncbi:hypothetical protein [Nocardia otitidiscaviarum]|uniref:hypothetical protein n=1 Tax=Nocardia otitidiscaviarum TaxID=1823 RepID=UPI0024578439|nr:hypothetical protein [Nocardia otitidiscaviarum]
MSLLALLVYPVMMLSASVGYTTTAATVPFLVLAVGLLLYLSITTHRAPWPQLMNRPRLTAAVLASIGAGGLAWLAVPTPLVGLLTGFSVFAMAPTWLTVTTVSGLFTTTRGVFTVIAAAWFGAILGYLATVVGTPLPGAVLTGIVGFTAAVMLLCSKVLAPHENKSAMPPRSGGAGDTRQSPAVLRRNVPHPAELRQPRTLIGFSVPGRARRQGAGMSAHPGSGDGHGQRPSDRKTET